MKNIRNFTIIAFILVNLSLPFFVIDIANGLGLAAERSGFIVAIHEFVCSVLAFLFLRTTLRRQEIIPAWQRHLPYLFLCLGLADLAYGIDYYLLHHIFKKSAWILTHEIPYILTMALLAEASLRRSFQDLDTNERRFIGATVAVLAGLYFLCSYKMVLSFQFPTGYNRPTLNYFTSYTYGIFQSLAMAGLLVASFRTTGTWEFLAWFLFIAMNGSDFALRYQDVGKLPLGTPIFEYGWEIAVAALSCMTLYQLLYPKRTLAELNSKPTSLQSIRVLAPLSTLGILLVFISLNLLVSPYFQIANINTISGHALIFAFTWVAANVMGIYLSKLLSRRITSLTEKLDSAQSLEDLGNFDGNLVELNPVLRSLHGMRAQIAKYVEENLTMKSAVAVGAAASRVAHNIRSPLSSLEMGINLIPAIPDPAASIIRKSLREIQDIAQDLSAQASGRTFSNLPTSAANFRKKPKTLQQLSSLLDSTISQKRLEHQARGEICIEFECQKSAESAFALVNPVEFSVIISNLVNNAIESMSGPGRVLITLGVNQDKAIISVIDSGKGIPSDLLIKLGDRVITEGKPGGSGVGLYHAKSYLKEWDGSLSLQSTVDQGTTVTLTLGRQKPPVWFTPEIQIPTSKRICIVDDDPLIHAFWKTRFAQLPDSNQYSLIHFQDPDRFRDWMAIEGKLALSDGVLFLVDYEFKGHLESGLDVIERSGIADNAILITGLDHKTSILERCQWLGTRLVSKALIGSIPIFCRHEPLDKPLNLIQASVGTSQEHSFPVSITSA